MFIMFIRRTLIILSLILLISVLVVGIMVIEAQGDAEKLEQKLTGADESNPPGHVITMFLHMFVLFLVVGLCSWVAHLPKINAKDRKPVC